MKVTQDKPFVPVVITLETPEEVSAFRAITNYPVSIAAALGREGMSIQGTAAVEALIKALRSGVSAL